MEKNTQQTKNSNWPNRNEIEFVNNYNKKSQNKKKKIYNEPRKNLELGNP
jgi:hypothetical protein